MDEIIYFEGEGFRAGVYVYAKLGLGNVFFKLRTFHSRNLRLSPLPGFKGSRDLHNNRTSVGDELFIKEGGGGVKKLR